MDKLAEIRQLYFNATKTTIARDFDRAVDVLKSMSSEEERECATVFMQGLAEMKTEWVAGETKNSERRTKNKRHV